MSDQILRAIQGVQKEIAEHRAYYVKNEAQTKQALITPILKALGWSEFRSAKSHFHMEYGEASEKVDYALIQDGKPVILLEAKELNDRLGKRAIRQVFDYYFHESVHIAVLTNGSDWRFYSPLLNSIRDFEGRCFLAINVERGEVSKLVEQFSNLNSRRTHRLDEFANHHWLLSTWEKKLNNDELIQPLIRPLRDSLPRELRVPPKDVREFVKTKLTEKVIRQTQLESQKTTIDETEQSQPQPEPQPTPPDTGRAVILAGEPFPVKHVYEILTQTVEWLIQSNHISPEECPIALQEGARNYIIHSQPIHGSGRHFVRQKQLSNGLYLDINWKQSNLVRRAHFLLERYGYPSSTLKLIGFDDQPHQTPYKQSQATQRDTGRAVILDGKRIAVTSMVEVCQAVGNWLIERGHVNHNECPIVTSTRSKTRYFIHTQPKHPNGNAFHSKKRLNNGLYIEAHASRGANHGYLRILLARYGYSQDTMKLEGFDD